MPKKALLRSVVSCILVLSLTSCTIGFDKDWKAAAASPATRNPKDLSGAWVGTWSNNSDKHTGGLWAIATPLPEAAPSSPARYEFRYKATWGRIFSGVFKTVHEAKRTGDLNSYALGGSKDLGILGGSITFGGNATPTHFRANYDSKANTGVFVLKRPE